jgi:hypothetical protein
MVGRLLERQRQALYLSKSEIGRRFTPPVTPQFIFNVETGRVRLPISRVTQACEILSIKPLELVEAYVTDSRNEIIDQLGITV